MINDNEDTQFRLLPPQPEPQSPTRSFISESGDPLALPERTGFGSIGLKRQLTSASLIDPTKDFDPAGLALSSIAGWFAHDQNLRDMSKIRLGVQALPGGKILNRRKNTAVDPETLKGTDLLDVIRPNIVTTLETHGFDPRLLEDQSFDDGQTVIQAFINSRRLEATVNENTNSFSESAGSLLAELGIDILTDPLNVVTFGSGSILRGVASKAAPRFAARAAARNTASRVGAREVVQDRIDRTAISLTNRLQRSGGVVGAAIDNASTRAHPAMMQAVDAGVFSAAFDVATQAKQGQMEREFLNPNGSHWSPVSTAFSAIAGASIGGGVGYLFFGRSATAGEARRTRVMSNTDTPFDNTQKPVQDVMTRPEDSFTPEDLTEDAARSVTESHLQAFKPTHRNAIKTAIDTAEDLDEVDFGRFMATRPSFRETLDFLGVPDDDAVLQLARERERVETDYQTKVANGELADDSPTHTNIATQLQFLDLKIAERRNPLKPKQGRLKTIVDDTAQLRDEFLDAVDQGKSQEEIARVQRAYFAKSDEVDQFVGEVTGQLNADGQKAFRSFAQSLEAPSATRMTREQQAEVLKALMHAGEMDFPLANPNITSRFLNWRGFGWLAGLGTRRHDMETIARKAPTVGLLANSLVPFAKTNSSLAPGVDSVTSRVDLLNQNKQRVSRDLLKATEDIYNRAGRDRDRITEDFVEALRVTGDPSVSTDDELVAALAFGYRNLYDDMREYGQRTGVLGPGLDDYVHLPINPAAANKHSSFLEKELDEWYRQTYAKRQPDTPLHRGTLTRAEIIDLDGNFDDFVVKPDIKSVRTREQLEGVQFSDGTLVLDRYDELIDETLNQHARNAIHNRVNPQEGKALSEVTQDEAEAGKINTSVRSDLDRKIEQEFFLQEDILKRGIIELNPILVGSSYMFGTGARIAKQDSINRITGRQDITWEGMIELARQELSSLSDKSVGGRRGVNAIIETLEDADRDISGKNIAVGEGEISSRALSANIRNFAAVPVQSGIPIAMLTLEIPSTVLKTAFGGGVGVGESMRTFIRAFTDSGFSKEQNRAAGFAIDHVTREFRHLADAGFDDQSVEFTLGGKATAPFRDIRETFDGDRTPRSLQGSTSPVINRVTSVTQAMADLTRAISTEDFLTNRSRAYSFYIHKQQAWEFLDKLGKLSEETIPDRDLKAFKGAARRAGINWKLAQEFVDSGLTGREFLNGSRILRQAGVKNIHNEPEVTKALRDIDDRAAREQARFAYQKVTDYAVNQTNNLIVNPSIWDRPSHANNPFIQLINTFLSHPRAFRNRRIRPLADQGAASLSFWYGFYLFAEVANRNLQDMVFDGKSPDDLFQEWEDDPDQMIFRSLNTVPALGPWQNALTSMIGNAAGVNRGVQLGGSPSLNIFGRAIEDATAVSRSAVGVDDADTSEAQRRVERFIPIWNFTGTQALRSIFEDGEEQ